MTDHLKQSISALLDEEASEIEVHRLLREFEDDDSLKLSWIRYQQIRAVSQGQHHLTETQHMTLHERISGAIAAEEADHELQAVPAQAGWQRQTAGFAVAASLVAAVFVGINVNQPGEPTLASLPESTTAPIDVQTVSTETPAASSVAFSEDVLELKELDELKQQQLREYLMRHDRISRINSNSRTVNFQPAAKGNN